MVVTLVQLLIPLRAVNDLNKGLEPLTVHALRLVKLTQCISAVMKFNESGETILHNPIMNKFFQFVFITDFANEVAENTQMTSPEMVIISWNDAEKREKRRQVHKLPIGIFNEVNALIGFSANRSLGVTVDVNDS
ncbi:15938_t:CDS:2 [Entrophospora sp. SA101]|nr:15938_t:CDS:2 [Entrophospora sp. SA101]